ncbi:unnamed protein product, partial [marine sediment metagenome]
MKYHKKLIFINLVTLFFVFHFFSLGLFSFNRIGLDQEYAQFFAKAKKSKELGKFDESIKLFEESLAVAKKINDGKRECESLLKLGLSYWNIAQFKTSSLHYKHALELAEKLDLKYLQEKCRSSLELYMLYKEGKKTRSSGEYEKSIEYFEQAIHLAEKSRGQEHKLKCLRQLSQTYWELDNYSKFFRLNEKALMIAQSLNHRKEEGICLFNLGIYYWNKDNYSKALSCYEKALIIAQSLKNKESESACLNNIGIIYEKIG